ncbi:MAG: hypothetical protein K9M99_03235 [Candidatus Cloacimonetes bacterium]|nr:hypothetical protein [Candidatus Cloacimonadota bacterium]
MIKYYLIILVLGSNLLLISNPLPLSGNISPEVIETRGCFAELLTDKGIRADAALLIGSDGTAALIEKSAFELILLHYDDPGWSSVSTSLPPVCNIKDLTEIALWQNPWDIQLEVDNIINYPQIYTPFTWIMKDFNYLATSAKNGYQVEKYKKGEELKNNDLSGVMTIVFSDDTEVQTSFEFDKFRFDGCMFWYDAKQIKKLSQEKP